MSVPQASNRGARSPGRRRSPRRGRAVPFAGFPGSVPLVGFPGSVPQACQSIQDEIDKVQADLNNLQAQLQHATGEEKKAIQADIREDNKQLVTLSNQLTECIASQPNVPPPTEAYFIGSSEFTTTNENAQGPFPDDLVFRVNIGGDPVRINIETFPALGALFETPLGTGMTTVTLIGGGTGSYDAGKISLPITLHFANTIDTGVRDITDSSDLSMVLSTDPPKGSPVTPAPGPFGNVTVFGSGQLVGGFLGGSTGTLKATGAIQPVVPVAVPYVKGLFWNEAQDEVRSANLVPEFFVDRAGGGGPNITPKSWVIRQSPVFGDMVERGTVVTMGVTDTEQT